MKLEIRFSVAALVACLVFSIGTTASRGQSHSEILGPYLTDDVAGVVVINLENLQTGPLKQLMEENFHGPEENPFEMIESTRDALKDVGAKHVYVLLRPAGMTSFDVPVVLSVSPEGNLADAQRVIQQIMEPRGMVTGRADGVIFAATNEQSLDRLKNARPENARDLSDALNALGSHSAAVILFGDDDTRRVGRELAIHPPAPFDRFDSKFLADRIAWGGIEIDLADKVKLNAIVEGNDEAAAQEFVSRLVDSLTRLDEFENAGQLARQLPDDFATRLAGEIEPEVNGSRVTIGINAGDPDSAMMALLGVVNGRANDATTANNLRQMMLAMHNFYDVYGRFPDPNPMTEDGKPGLGWRVQLLPFLEQDRLYQQFHHDEPWDSEHNLKIAEQMPEIFQTPGVNGNKTIYQVPVAPFAVYQAQGNEEVTFAKITDGLSNTIGLVLVNPAKAVLWTQPVDWQVDENAIRNDLLAEDQSTIIAGMFDGSSHQLRPDITEESLKAMITGSGGEVIDRGN